MAGCRGSRIRREAERGGEREREREGERERERETRQLWIRHVSARGRHSRTYFCHALSPEPRGSGFEAGKI